MKVDSIRHTITPLTWIDSGVGIQTRTSGSMGGRHSSRSSSSAPGGTAVAVLALLLLLLLLLVAVVIVVGYCAAPVTGAAGSLPVRVNCQTWTLPNSDTPNGG